MTYLVNMTWDNEAAVWVATSDDVPRLALESGSLDALMERVRFAVPELLRLNGSAEQSIPLATPEQQKPFIDLADKMFALNANAVLKQAGIAFRF
ncbi:MAG: DUF1902 domain-containing protein [Spirochaetales bacterium]|nr:DUF1902 domain-containing protein [Spirochaetales bacterium]